MNPTASAVPRVAIASADTGPRGRDLEVALAAVRAACRAVAAVGRPEAFDGGAVVQKGAAGPLTLADLASQVAAVREIAARLGDSEAIVAEESADEAESLGGAPLLDRVAGLLRAAGMPADRDGVRSALGRAASRDARGRCWAIDPLDGTKGFLRGGQFAIAVALVEHGAPVVAALGLPRLGPSGIVAGPGTVAFATAGGGAFQVPVDGGRPAPLRAAPWAHGGRVRLAGSVERSHSAGDEIEAAIASLGTVDPIRVDSQAKYALVARGDADAYVRLSPSPSYRECVWDHAAGALVAGEAGCTVTDAAGRRLDFTCGRRLEANVGIVCAMAPLHQALLASLAGLGGSR